MNPAWVLSLPEGVAVSSGPGGEAVLTGPHSRLTLRQPPGPADALPRLAPPGETALRLTEAVRTAGGPAALARWQFLLAELARRGFLHIMAHAGPERLATLIPTTPNFAFSPPPAAGKPVVLSRFTCTRRVGETLLVESPLCCARVVLHGPRAAALLHALARPTTAAEVPGLPADAAAALVELLAGAGLLTTVADDGTTAEDADPALATWAFHDLLFHARSRAGRHDSPVGATFPFVGRLEAPPAVKPAAAEGVELFRPDLVELRRSDPPFAEVQERRRSVREYAAEPITAEQLGEFLFRVARVRDRRHLEVETPHGPVELEFTSRPYPAGGGLYELEVYPVVNACRGLDAGLYHYDPVGHRLEPVAGRTVEVGHLLDEAARSTGMAPEGLQVLLVLAARFPRVAWKYSMLAYALTLKHVGVVYQTMYLAATAMGLAPCAVGSGDSDLFARTAGVDYCAETSVGEFLLGSRPG